MVVPRVLDAVLKKILEKRVWKQVLKIVSFELARPCFLQKLKYRIEELLFTIKIMFTRFTRNNFVGFKINTGWIRKINFISWSNASVGSGFGFTINDKSCVNFHFCFCEATTRFQIFWFRMFGILVLSANEIDRFRINSLYFVAVEFCANFSIKSIWGSKVDLNNFSVFKYQIKLKKSQK